MVISTISVIFTREYRILDPKQTRRQASIRYPASRKITFSECRDALSPYVVAANDRFIVARGDSLNLTSLLPEKSIGLILTDPPYHSTQKSNITNDKQFKENQEYLSWLAKYAAVFKQVCRENGSVYLFCSMKLAAHIEVMLENDFNCLASIAWAKPNLPGYDGWKGKVRKSALRAWYPHSERILFLEPAFHGNLRRSTFGAFLSTHRKRLGMSTYDLAEVTESYGAVNHGGAVSNWEAGRNIPSREQYSKIIGAFSSIDKSTRWPSYEDVVRPFHANGDIEFTDVWNYYSVRPYKGKHPAEKPQDMLTTMVTTSSYPEDIVLDCFGGSGATALAAIRSGRRAILIDIDEHWCQYAADRLAAECDRLHLPKVEGKRVTTGELF